ncbi:MAG TPA: TnsA endonuclease N-terminal domain-containing protein [Pyrinomonadaceae bacterium]|jgi:transposase InsO family protein
MISDAEFDQWCRRLNLSSEAQIAISQIRNSNPVRAVRSFRGNVSGRYPSRKMGVTIQFESHKNELAFIYEYEHDSEVLEYYDQPSTIKLNYPSPNRKNLGALHTPDFFVLRTHTAGWEECKTEEQLAKLTSRNQKRYIQDNSSKWRCPPGEEYAEKLGLYYGVRSSEEINWIYQRNIEFLDDYFRFNLPIANTGTHTALLAYVAKEPGITLKELFRYAEEFCSRDDIYTLIAHDGLYVDLYSFPLVEPDKVFVFPDSEAAFAYKNVMQIQIQGQAYISQSIDLVAGGSIQWDGKGWKIVNVGETLIGLLGEANTFTELPINVFEKLVQENHITGIESCPSQSLSPEARQRFEQADKGAYAEANHRFKIVQAHLRGDPLLNGICVSERTLRRWTANYRLAQQTHGRGYIGLIPRIRTGNTNDRLPSQTRVLLDEFIKNDYETLKQKRKFEVYASFLLVCQRRGVLPVAYKTFCKAVKLRPRYNQLLKRQGRRAAYKDQEFYWELTQTTPCHGERPFHIAHIDHTELDQELVCSITGQNLGRTWATFLMDAFSRRILATYLTYDPPSYLSSMMIIRECVRRFGRLPQIVIVDKGLEFSSTYFETLLAVYECTKKTRPPTEGRFGSVCERLFGTTNTQFIHNLQGNTQIMRNVRQVTKSNDPRQHAIWTLEKIYLYLHQWAYEVYDTNGHPALGQSSRDAFASGMLYAGERSHRLILYNNDFRMLTLPTTAKTTAKVQIGRGVKINNIYYWSDVFRHPNVESSQVPVRFDPWDAGLAFAYARGRWTDCYSEKYAVFHGRSEREILIATAELRKRQLQHSRRFNITAAQVACFLESIEAEEVLLRQRATDRESQGILSMIDSSFQIQANRSADRPSSLADAPCSDPCSEPVSSNSLVEVLPPKMYGEF